MKPTNSIVYASIWALLFLPHPSLAQIQTEQTTGEVSALRELTLIEAIQQSLENNQTLLAGRQTVAAGAAQVRSAQSILLPQLSVQLAARQIDQDRAEASTGRAPEQLSSSALTFQQTVFSEQERARYQVEKILQEARQEQQLARVLDTVLDTATAFLNLLRQQSLANIQRQNLKLIESNYRLAENRLQLGVANRTEVYRWETQQAAARQGLTRSNSRFQQARIELNRIMNAPLTDQYQAAHPDLTAPELLVSSEPIRQAFGDPGVRPLLRQYYLNATVSDNPELNQLRQAKKARARQLLAARRNLYLPRFEITGELNQELGRSGAGTDKLDIDFGKIFPGRASGQIGGLTDKREWQLGITARLPLYLGGQQYSERARQQAELEQIQLLYDQTQIDTEAGVMSQLLETQASFENIGFARTAAQAARNNLSLVTQAYDQGVTPIIDLLDAQIASLGAEESQTNTIYDFLINYLQLQRFTGRFDITSTVEERQQMQQSLEQLLRH